MTKYYDSFSLTEVASPEYKLTEVLLDGEPIDINNISVDKTCTITFKHEKKDNVFGATHQVMSNDLKIPIQKG